MFTKTDVAQVCAMPATTIQRWMDAGHVAPTVRGSDGRGNSAKFSPMQAVGLGVADQLRRQGRGASLEYIGAVVTAFGAITEKELQDQFAEGRTHFVLVHHAKPLLRGKAYDWIDVRAIYQAVKAAAVK